jgi:glycosyltransferase involved in cell wall biosynthesis
MSLCVAVDVTAAVTQRAGIARYMRELVHALAQLQDGPELRPFAVTKQQILPLEDGLRTAQVPQDVNPRYAGMMARHLLHRPARGPWDGADVYHAEVVAYPPVRHIPVVTMVYDLSYIIYPRYHTFLYGTYLRLMTPVFTRRAQLVVTDSVATMRDLVERVGVPERKIRVVYPGVSSVFRQPITEEYIATVRRRYNLPSSFLLSVGTLEPRKNLHGTLQAHRLLRQRLSDAPPLVLVGGSGWRLDEEDLIGKDAHTVRRLGYVPDEDLAALYASCSAFVYPSFYEGFGLPIIEAMTLGAATITSNVSSLPEVAGDAAVLVDPSKPEEIAAAMEKLLVDEKLRARLQQAGLARARLFSYETCAADMMKVYQEVANG